MEFLKCLFNAGINPARHKLNRRKISLLSQSILISILGVVGHSAYADAGQEEDVQQLEAITVTASTTKKTVIAGGL